MRIAMEHLPLDTRMGDGRSKRATWAGSTVRVIELPPDGTAGHVGTDQPQGLCASDHWGYVLEGSIEVRFAFGERETARSGDLYYWPALHTCWTDEGVRYLDFSPAEDPERLADPRDATGSAP